MKLPTIHLNGTSNAELDALTRAAYESVADAIAAFQKAAPSARDYYPQGPDEAVEVAAGGAK